jgi:hypothetical protein
MDDAYSTSEVRVGDRVAYPAKAAANEEREWFRVQKIDGRSLIVTAERARGGFAKDFLFRIYPLQLEERGVWLERPE